MSRPLCKTCRFFELQGEVSKDGIQVHGGFCKRNPPTVLSFPVQRQSLELNKVMMDIQLKSVHPPVGINEWCGCHEERTE